MASPMGPDELPEEAGLAHAGFSDYRNDLAMSGTGLIQGLAEGLQFSLPPDEACEPAHRSGLQASPRGASPNNLVYLYRCLQPSHRHWTKRLDLHKALCQSQGLCGE